MGVKAKRKSLFVDFRAAGIGLTIAATLMLSSCNESSCDRDKDQEVPEIHAKVNADGNYNIVFITTDQEHYFPEFPKGTNYKARELLMEMGTTFEKHYACATMSTSSRSVIYTGTHITDTRMIDNTDYPWQDPLSEDLTAVGDLMTEAGFYAAYKGKWHMGDESMLEDDTEPELQQQDGLVGYGFHDWNPEGDITGEANGGYEDDAYIASEAVGWLRSTGKEKNDAGTSFFLAVNLVNPHDIMYFNTDAPGENVQDNGHTSLEIFRAPDNDLYRTTYPGAPIPSTWSEPVDAEGRVAAHMEYYLLWNRRVGAIPPEEERWERFRDYYYNCIQDNDNNLMDILQEIIRLGMLDNTIIVFTSDHGETQGAHGLRGKGGFMYENNIHVPLIVCHPEHKGGRRVSAITSHIDLAPTFVDMTGLSDQRKAEITGGLPGHSLLDLIDGSEIRIRDGALFAFEMVSMLDSGMTFVVNEDGNIVGANIDFTKRGFVRGIITERYKFARYFSPLEFNSPAGIEELYSFNDVELYDLENDPEERLNLAVDAEENADLIMDLNDRLNGLVEKEIGVDDGEEVEEIIESMWQ